MGLREAPLRQLGRCVQAQTASRSRFGRLPVDLLLKVAEVHGQLEDKHVEAL